MPSPYIPQFREPENDAENIDITTSSGHFKNRQKIKKPNLAQQESSNSPAAAIRNQVWCLYISFVFRFFLINMENNLNRRNKSFNIKIFYFYYEKSLNLLCDNFVGYKIL